MWVLKCGCCRDDPFFLCLSIKFLYKYEARMVFLRGEGVTLKHASLQIEAV